MIKKRPRVALLHIILNTSLLVAIVFGFSSCALFSAKQQNNNAQPTPQKIISFPVRQGLLNDYAHALDSASRDRLTKMLQELNQSKGVETVVVLVNNTGGEPIFDYSLQLANQWRIGSNGRGALFMVAIEDRQWRIQVTKALEGVLTGDVCREIGDKSAGFFKKKDYAAGVESFVKELASKL
jgi:uncharacterized protein